MSTRALLAAGAVVAALAAGAATSTAAAGPETIRLLAINVYAGFEGYDPAGFAPPTVGSGFVGTGTLYHWAGTRRGARAGTIRILCTFTQVPRPPQPAWTLCNATLFLAGGEIELSGFVPQTSLLDLPIVGGTRAYSNVTGDLHVDRIGVNKFADVLHVRL